MTFDDMKSASPIIVYTDGGCQGNPGPGGWGCVVIADGEARELSGGEAHTTNNKMELTAAIMALTIIRNTQRFAGRPITLYSDSQYVRNGITGWIFNWKKNGWKKPDKKPALNPDLWERLLALTEKHELHYHWVKGHAENAYNNRCDALAVAARERIVREQA